MTDWWDGLWEWWVSCARKGRLSEQAAKQIVRKRELRDHILLYRYRCRHCNAWHLTSRHPRELKEHRGEWG